MTNYQNNKSKKMTKSDWIGAVVGFFIANIIFQRGNFDFISAFVIAYGSYWVVKKIAQFFLKEKRSKDPEQRGIDNSKQHNSQNEMKILRQKYPKKKLIWLGIILFAVVVMFVLSSLFSPNKQDVNFVKTDKSDNYSEQDGNLYRNTKYNFRIKFPEGWKIEKGDGLNILRKAIKGNSTISVGVKQIPMEFGDNIETIKDVMSITEFRDTSFNGLQKKFPGVKIIDYGESKLDNIPAYWIKYSTPYSVLDVTVNGTQIQYLLLHNNTFYVIAAGSSSDEYPLIEGEILKSISTFVIED